MSDVVWTVTCGLYVPSSGAASGLHLFVSPGRVTTTLKAGTYVPRCTASFPRTLESFFLCFADHASQYIYLSN